MTVRRCRNTTTEENMRVWYAGWLVGAFVCRITQNSGRFWPWSTATYRRRTKRLDFGHPSGQWTFYYLLYARRYRFFSYYDHIWHGDIRTIFSVRPRPQPGYVTPRFVVPNECPYTRILLKTSYIIIIVVVVVVIINYLWKCWQNRPRSDSNFVFSLADRQISLAFLAY